jgi:hypothetical protein
VNILEIDFSFSNDVFISVSRDGALKMWGLSDDEENQGSDQELDLSSRRIHALPLRTVRLGIPLSCVEFHPLNATYVVVCSQCFSFFPRFRLKMMLMMIHNWV